MGINMNEAFPSKWLRADDIDRETPVTISDVTMEPIADDERKPVIWFNEFDKGMVLNKTNANNVSGIYGPDTDLWIGKQMSLATAMVDFQGRSTRALRLYPPPRRAAQPAARPAARGETYAQQSGGSERQFTSGLPDREPAGPREFAPLDEDDIRF